MSIDRRDFLKLSAASAAAFASEKLALADDQDALVTPNAKQARPITRDEFLLRQENAVRYMVEAGINAILLTGGTSLQYFAGTQWGISERLFAMVLPARGGIAWVTPAFEEGRAREQIKFGDDIRIWQEDESPYKVVAAILKDRGVVSGTIGIEETVRFAFADGVAKAAPSLKVVSADPVTARCRRVKSAHEIELMRLANQITLKAFEIALKSLRPGMTQTELGGKIGAAHQEMGARGGALVLYAEHSASPHGTIAPQKLKEGDV
ncbi:MAG TPA: aminopeptidase P family N-terminal domain-containing protein, partial [Blastocatellia bacterium]|nr:aminopeptidase P family N-terminal domain-containing protein [Blastocatellia bacterium]